MGGPPSRGGGDLEKKKRDEIDFTLVVASRKKRGQSRPLGTPMGKVEEWLGIGGKGSRKPLPCMRTCCWAKEEDEPPWLEPTRKKGREDRTKKYLCAPGAVGESRKT